MRSHAPSAGFNSAATSSNEPARGSPETGFPVSGFPASDPPPGAALAPPEAAAAGAEGASGSSSLAQLAARNIEAARTTRLGNLNDTPACRRSAGHRDAVHREYSMWLCSRRRAAVSTAVHRLRARAEDRIRNARDTGLRNLPLHHAAQNQAWLEIVSLALDLLAWMPILAPTGQVRRWEPKKLRPRLFSAAAQAVTTSRRKNPAFPEPLALGPPDHRGRRTTGVPPASRLTGSVRHPDPPPHPAPTLGPGAYPTRQPGLGATDTPAHRKHPQPSTQTVRQQADGPSRG
ncbi:hypothetical protein GCM10023205_40760 [Yinghuangia aomiensis]|uniref:Transposase DDE domain-containing protein n=1 Tax=Yinghuangia aomiensis TaxID=676205 RepID=A0ABP9HHF3_9ACTN